jgi:hypothetical protein
VDDEVAAVADSARGWQYGHHSHDCPRALLPQEAGMAGIGRRSASPRIARPDSIQIGETLRSASRSPGRR